MVEGVFTIDRERPGKKLKPGQKMDFAEEFKEHLV